MERKPRPEQRTAGAGRAGAQASQLPAPPWALPPQGGGEAAPLAQAHGSQAPWGCRATNPSGEQPDQPLTPPPPLHFEAQGTAWGTALTQDGGCRRGGDQREGLSTNPNAKVLANSSPIHITLTPQTLPREVPELASPSSQGSDVTHK